ncbi:MAG: PorP/SprF family type IX secretion system membrane protein [Bacteroidales bacterium]|nr:PorP/SprF family type IX secretion system membrane protein [Bacteroidales bacterium]
MRKYWLSLFIMLLLQLELSSQQLAEHSLYHYKLSVINPAAAAWLPCKQFILTDRHQWTGIAGSPSIQSLSVQLPKEVHKYRKFGVGLNIVHDVNGASQNLGGEVQYAYHLTLRTLTPLQLSFGLAGKFGQYSFDESDFNSDLYDPLVSYGRQSEWYYNVAAGIFLYSEDFFAGVGVYNLLPGNTSLYQSYGNSSYFTTLIAGYTIHPRRYPVKIIPSVYFAHDTNMNQLDLNAKLIFENGLWTGLCIRKYLTDAFAAGQNALIFLGYEFGNWNVAYTYDLGLNSLQLHHLGSHQLSVCYTLCREKYACPTY